MIRPFLKWWNRLDQNLRATADTIKVVIFSTRTLDCFLELLFELALLPHLPIILTGRSRCPTSRRFRWWNHSSREGVENRTKSRFVTFSNRTNVHDSIVFSFETSVTALTTLVSNFLLNASSFSTQAGWDAEPRSTVKFNPNFLLIQCCHVRYLIQQNKIRSERSIKVFVRNEILVRFFRSLSGFFSISLPRTLSSHCEL